MDATKMAAKSLRDIRINEGISQAELSEMSGLTQMTISTIETGRRKPKIETVEKLAGCLGYEINIKFKKV